MKTKFYSLLTGACLLLGTPMVLQAQPGAMDPTFNGTGSVVHPINTLDGAQKILVQGDQKVLLVGMSFDATYTARAYAFRYLPDGTPDSTFATNGVFSYEQDNEADIYSAVLTPGGKILLVGSTTDYQTYKLLLIQLKPDGTLDNSFGTNGVVLQSVSVVTDNAEDMAYDVALDASNNILVCGSTDDANYIRHPFVTRFTPSGVLDTTFGLNGLATIPSGVGSSKFKGIVIQPDGKIVASGSFGNTLLWSVMLVVRFDADGSLDATFGDAGILTYNYGNVDDEGNDITLTPDGSFLVAGSTATQDYNYSALLAKFTPAGALDTSFGNAGTVEEDLAMFDFASNVAVLADGRIMMAGSSGVGPPSTFDLAVWKYMPDGTPDTGFGTDGFAQHVIGVYSTMIYAMGIQADGKILIGGQARTSTNQNYFYLGRLQNELTTGIAELSGLGDALVYPDPATASSMVTMQVSESIKPGALISLYSTDGRLVFMSNTDHLQGDAQHVRFQLPSDIAPGIYQLSFQQQGTRRSSSLLITQ